VYVRIDSKTGEFRGVIASVYHWLRGSSRTISLDGTHPKLRVISPWHHYTAAEKSGELLEVRDLSAKFDAWLKNGMHEDLEPGAARNPWLMTGPEARAFWWRDDTLGFFSLTAFRVRISRWLGFGEEGVL